MTAQDLRPGTRIRSSGSVFEIRQSNLFVNSKGSFLGGVVFPERNPERFCRGFCATSILDNGQITRAKPTVS